MKLSTQPYRGTRDFYPEDFRVRQYIFDTWSKVAESFGYEAYDAPLIEPLDLYRAKTGEEIVNEQTYNFTDRGDREVAIRPEMTPTVARMVAARRNELGYPLRWYNIGNRWRYERPQRGRVREFWQLDIDLFGLEGNLAELEILQIADGIMKGFGAKDEMYTIRLNSRSLIHALLKDYFELSDEQVSTVSRLIDKMAKIDEKVFTKELGETMGERGTELQKILQSNQLEALPKSVRQLAGDAETLIAQAAEVGLTNVQFDMTLMRGLEYYTDIVFEVFDTNPENSRSLFGGGRYDGLVGLFGVHDLPAVGFAIGDVTMRDFLETHQLLPETPTKVDLYLMVEDGKQAAAQKHAQSLREKGKDVAVDLSGRDRDKQFKAAKRLGFKDDQIKWFDKASG